MVRSGDRRQCGDSIIRTWRSGLDRDQKWFFQGFPYYHICQDIGKTQLWCENIMKIAMKRIESNDHVFKKNVTSNGEED